MVNTHSKHKKNIKSNRFLDYMSKKPEGNFWMYAFFYLFLFRYVGPMMIVFLMFFMLGLAAPESDISQTIQNTTETLAESFMFLGETMFESGQTIAINNPILSKVIFFIIANFVYVIWFGAICMILHLLRYGIYYLFFRKKEAQSK